jgi:uncharacterized SAM-binding protein YcdF (DUF218 family)
VAFWFRMTMILPLNICAGKSSPLRKWGKVALLWGRRLLVCGGLVFVLLLALCWTDYPWRLYYWLSIPEAHLQQEPDWIVVLGGGGIPSESGLIRCYHAAEAATRFPEARVVVALPGNPADPESQVRRMADELILRGVAADRIEFEPKGANTRSQAVEWRRQFEGPVDQIPVLIVTSSAHMRRAIRSFQHVGFTQAGSVATQDHSVDGSLELSEDSIDAPLILPDLEGSLFVRYRFWDSMGYLTRSSRELVALLYYRVRGYI